MKAVIAASKVSIPVRSRLAFIFVLALLTPSVLGSVHQASDEKSSGSHFIPISRRFAGFLQRPQSPKTGACEDVYTRETQKADQINTLRSAFE